ncbi:MAG: adenine phosphoribosyltransferase [Actinobacteria bacterium 13_2_20CM_2_66_6]|nr:MAG: adenine phosphoribosyltransferase [Actinobacteria bacterium 13_2_20CM_2_66_6]TME92952.1 MAG: adenine phosphoribosyltransferase [Chloroflexota bacterium]
MTRPEQLKKLVRDVPDFPQPGIIFRDITPILADKTVFREVIDLMSKHWVDKDVDHVAAIEARGFIPGAAIAIRLNAGFIPIRKAGKLPWRVLSHSYQLEYGTDQLDVHEDALTRDDRVLIVDDVLATGGTAAAAVELVRKLGGDVVGVQVLIELSALAGRKRLSGIDVVSELVY